MKFYLSFLILLFGFQIEAQIQPSQKAATAKSFTLGAELRSYAYSEPSLVEHSGLMYGVWAEWYWSSALGNGKLYGNFLYGLLDYKGQLCNQLNNCVPYEAKTKDMIAKVATRFEFEVQKTFRFFAGLGFRYLYDMGEGVGFYQRTGQWVFIPVGAELDFNSDIGKFSAELEYDQIIYGKIRSNLSDVGGGYEDLEMDQTGYGIVVGLSYRWNPDWKLGGFYERWDLNRSNSVSTNGQTFVEPKNHSDSFGLRVGYLF
ncbi:hypothetical protein [Pseudobdellovibrio exovorus]|uniref:Outer membrane protein beta-barrel domain-containing protein n=1 Tax=Pseudobdellovibrio exovorus JSS TaxID=1184267 RepID=M4VBB8_9BACT|nr:hypothetical protein [Pseudobdellovibrio exovorus]AGH95321.1 hypothetical protein A11Q_1105 [Pseudobdellovibrio exovorus JSS]